MTNETPRRGVFKTGLIAALAILICMARRPNQINYPEVWVEEGTQFFNHFFERGWLFLFEPVNGYLILPSKLIAFISYHISFIHYPVVSYVLTLLVSALVAVTIYKAPTHLPYRAIAALTPFLIPFDPEPIAIGEYIFWFVGLFSVLALLWKGEGQLRLRVGLVIIGGLSAPLGVSILPLFIVRTLWTRSRSDVIVTAAAICATLVQLYFYLNSGRAASDNLVGLLQHPYDNFLVVVTKFLAEYFWAKDPLTLLGLGVFIALVMLLSREVREGRYASLALLVCAAISIVLSITRVPLEAINAMGNGPRYFFYPYIFLSWALLAFSVVPERRKSLMIAGVIVMFNSATFFYRPHDDLNWSEMARRCLETPGETVLPVHHNGMAPMAWSVTLTQEQCQELEQMSLF